MADTETYRDWQLRTDEARKILSDKNLALWEKVHKTGSAYAGLTLSGLSRKHRQRFLKRVSRLNIIFAQYQLETFDDYQHIAESGVIRRITHPLREMSKYSDVPLTPSVAQETSIWPVACEFEPVNLTLA